MNLQEIAQKIVNATIEIIDGRNVNIMDCDGFIIASGDKSRINTYHKGADEVIKSGKVIEIYPKDVHDYPGSKEGVNMPVAINGKAIGVVGVYGHPDEVRVVAKLVKMSVELAFEQYLISEQVKLVQDLKQQFIRKLIYEDAEKNEEEILCLSKIAGIDLNKHRCAVVLRMSDNSQMDSLQLLKFMDKIEQLLLNSGYIGKEDFAGIINQYFVIFKKISLDFYEGSRNFLEKMNKSIYQHFGHETRIAMGSFHKELTGYKKSFEEAVILLDISNQPVRDINNLEIQADYLLNKIDDYILKHFAKVIYEKLLDDNGKVQSWVISTLKALFDNNLNVLDAARSLYIHKNTMTYRIKKIEEISGLSVNTNFYHAILLKIFVIYMERVYKV